MERRLGDIVQKSLIGLLVFLPIVANATLPGAERAPAANFVAYGASSLLFALLLVVLRIPRWVALPFVVIGVGYASFVWGCGCDVSYHAISALWETNRQEVAEFLRTSMAGRSTLLAIVLFFVTFFVLVRRWRSEWATRTVRLPRPVWIGGLAVAGVALLAFRVAGNEFSAVYPGKFIERNLTYLHEVHEVRGEYAALPYTYAGPEVPPEPLTLLLVVGESARAQNWSLYGYDRDTNPELRRRLEEAPERSFLLRPAVPAGRVTRVSVPSMLSVAPAREYPEFYRRPTAVRIFRRASLATFMASAQLPTGYYEGLPNMVLDEAETTRRVRGLDENLLPPLDEFFGDGRPVRLIVLQLQGSHLKYDRRYPETFARFEGRGDLVDSYDDSILYTDHLLSVLLARLEARPEPAVLLYTSDHGENLDDEGDGNFSHGARAITPWELSVPMFLAVNAAFARERPETAANLRRNGARPGHHDFVAPTLLGLAGLKDPAVYDPRLDLSSPAFDPPEPWFAENLRIVMPYRDLPAPAGLVPSGPSGGSER